MAGRFVHVLSETTRATGISVRASILAAALVGWVSWLGVEQFVGWLTVPLGIAAGLVVGAVRVGVMRSASWGPN